MTIAISSRKRAAEWTDGRCSRRGPRCDITHARTQSISTLLATLLNHARSGSSEVEKRVNSSYARVRGVDAAGFINRGESINPFDKRDARCARMRYMCAIYQAWVKRRAITTSSIYDFHSV